MKKKYGIQVLKFFRNAAFLFLFSVSGIWAYDTGAQNVGDKLNVKSGTIASIFNQIREQTDLEFFYNTDDLDVNRRIDKDFKSMPLTAILDEILGDRYTYVLKDNYILITTKSPSQQASTVTIRGTVRDEQGNPLHGATVSVSGKRIAVQTGADGSFTLEAPASKRIELTVSFLGMQQTTAVYTGKYLNIVMKEAVTVIEDVVVTGYFPRIKEGFAGASTTITRDELAKFSTNNIFTTISMLDAGFKIEQNNVAGSNPNVVPEFTMRGRGSFQEGSSTPLFILDGFEVSVEAIFDLDINRIESITLLKDAAAAILYGSRAANGVVVIETLLPQKGEIRVSYTFKPTISIVDLTGYDLMNAAEKLEYERRAGLFDKTSELVQSYEYDAAYYARYKNVIEGVDTYWLSKPVENTLSQHHSLRAEGGVEQITYAIDAGYNIIKGVMKKSGRNVTSLGVTLGYRIRDKVAIQNRVSYSHTHAYNSPYGSFSQYAQMNPYERIYDENGEFIPILLNDEANPLYDGSLPNRDYTNTQYLNEQLVVDWTINSDLRMRGQLGIAKNDFTSEKYTSPYSAKYILSYKYNSETQQWEYDPIEYRGELSITNGTELNASGNINLMYNKAFAVKHLIYINIGSEFSTRSRSSNGYILTGFADDRFSDPVFAMRYKKGTKASSSESTTRMMGVLGNFNYIFDNRFFVDLSTRIDGSSAFGADKKYSVFWSVGGGWNIHNESFWSPNSTLDVFRLRASYGVTGNQEFNAYQAKTTYTIVEGQTYWNTIPAIVMTYGNTDLSWQNKYSSNIGIDFGLAGRRLLFSVDFYDETTKNTVTDITVAPSIGLRTGSYKDNLGEINNRGYSFHVQASLIRNLERQLEWIISANGAYTRNKIVKISNMLKQANDVNNKEQYLPKTIYEEGRSMYTIMAVQSLGIDPVNGLEIFVKKDGTLTNEWDSADKIVAGNTEPKLSGTFGTNLEFRNWNLNMNFDYTFGGDYYNQTLSSRVEGANPAFNADRRALYDRWAEPGDHALYTKIATRDIASNIISTNYISTRYVQRNNTMNLKSLSLSYDFDKGLIKRYGLNLLRISFYANDLLRISSIKEERGTDYPFNRTFVFELKLMF